MGEVLKVKVCLPPASEKIENIHLKSEKIL